MLDIEILGAAVALFGFALYVRWIAVKSFGRWKQRDKDHRS